jgi:hypothetical protein
LLQSIRTAGHQAANPKRDGRRTREGAAHRSHPYGKRLANDGRHLEENPGEQAILHQIRWLRAKGITVLGICDRLTEKQLFNRAGKPFRESHVAQLLERHGNGGLPGSGRW